MDVWTLLLRFVCATIATFNLISLHHKRLIKYARVVKITGAIMSGIAVAVGYFYQSIVWKCIGFVEAVCILVSVICKKL